eukprot:1290337-Rhodomonas_salina.1
MRVMLTRRTDVPASLARLAASGMRNGLRGGDWNVRPGIVETATAALRLKGLRVRKHWQPTLNSAGSQCLPTKAPLQVHHCDTIFQLSNDVTVWFARGGPVCLWRRAPGKPRVSEQGGS